MGSHVLLYILSQCLITICKVRCDFALGFQSHKQFLEKPVLLTKFSILSAADLLFVLVKSINNNVFQHVMERSATSQLKIRYRLDLA
jgi:hypothetical protein